jgi:D-psicose/D-tagatose/L-ribulose 3-epimerase
MKFGINTLLWTAAFDRSNVHLLPRIKEAGFDGVEIARFAFHDFPVTDIRRALEENGLECIMCSALTGKTSLADPDTHTAALDFLKQGIRAAADLGAKLFVGPFCSPVGYLTGRRRTQDEWSRVTDGLRELGPVLEDAGVTMAVEPLNRFETFFLNTAHDARQLADTVSHPRVGILLDTFHANIEEKSIGAAAELLGDRLVHVHACENDRGIPGTGHVEWPELFGALRKTDYNGWLVIESFGFAIPEIATAACIWRDLASSPEAIAWDGLKFLRSM